MLLLVLVFVQPFYSLWVSQFLSALVLATMAITRRYTLIHPPTYSGFRISLSEYAVHIVSWPLLALALKFPLIWAAVGAEASPTN